MLNENPNTRIRLEGHTEIYGNKKGLMKLSKERVLAVKNYLVKKGISKKRIDYQAFGPTKPITTEDTEKARQLNRRVEIRVI
jgi:outer membrane protein OmpA-like peptidoglycan-associated protein